MIKDTIVSIIVPVYNIEKYIAKCINSVITQTFTDWELILVNDGSTDNSGKICDEYALKDSRIKVIHKGNGGPASARYLGIDNSNGNFVFFLDGDDYIPNDALQNLYNTYVNDNYSADIICGDSYIINERITKTLSRGDFILLTGNEISENIFVAKFKPLWGMLILKDLLKNIEIKATDIYIGEDLIAVFQLMAHAKRVINSHTVSYCYNIRINSTSMSRIIEKEKKNDIIKLIKYYVCLLEILQISKIAKSGIKFEISKCCYSHIRINRKLGIEKKIIMNQLINCYKDYNTRKLLKEFSFKYYCFSFLIFISPQLWSYIINRLLFK